MAAAAALLRQPLLHYRALCPQIAARLKLAGEQAPAGIMLLHHNSHSRSPRQAWAWV
jgi:hypothetical protein